MTILILKKENKFQNKSDVIANSFKFKGIIFYFWILIAKIKKYEIMVIENE